MIRDEAQGTIALRSSNQLRQGRHDASEIVKERGDRLSPLDVAPGTREPGRPPLCSSLGSPTGEGVPHYHRPIDQCLGEHLVMIRQAGKRSPPHLIERPQIEHTLRRASVRLGKHHIEDDRRRAPRIERLDQLGNHCSRPRPLADPRQTGLVDIHDLDRHRLVLPRLKALIKIEA